jgi:hypothetical protein
MNEQSEAPRPGLTTTKLPIAPSVTKYDTPVPIMHQHELDEHISNTHSAEVKHGLWSAQIDGFDEDLCAY